MASDLILSKCFRVFSEEPSDRFWCVVAADFEKAAGTALVRISAFSSGGSADDSGKRSEAPRLLGSLCGRPGAEESIGRGVGS